MGMVKKKNAKRLLHRKKYGVNTKDYHYDDSFIADFNGKDYVVLDSRTKPEEINNWRITQAIVATKTKFTEPSSRMILQEHVGEIVTISGLVSDIVIDFKHTQSNENQSRILIEHPILEFAHTKMGNKYYFKNIDSHIWLKTSEIKYCNAKRDEQRISIGDIIYISAEITEYRGRGDYNVFGQKYGLKEIQVFESGVLVVNKKSKSTAFPIRSDYPRGDDWIMYLKRHQPRNENEPRYLVEYYRLQKSKYPTYLERM